MYREIFPSKEIKQKPTRIIKLPDHFKTNIEEQRSLVRSILPDNTAIQEELDDKMLKEMSDLYRYVFNNGNAAHYLVYPKAFEFVSPKEVFGEEGYIDLERMDSFNPKNYPRHPITGEEAVVWHNPDATYNVLKNKLNHDAQISLVKNENEKIIAMTYGHKCTVKEQFEKEGWTNPFLYTGIEIPEHSNNLNDNIKTINAFLEKNRLELSEIFAGNIVLTPDTEVYSWNTMVVSPEAQGRGALWKITTQLFDLIPSIDKNTLNVMGETVYGGVPHGIFTKGHAVSIPGVFQPDNGKLLKGDIVLTFANMSDYENLFARASERVPERDNDLAFERMTIPKTAVI